MAVIQNCQILAQAMIKHIERKKNAISIVLFPLDIFTNWQEIMIDMLVRGDAFQVFIQATSVSLQAPGRLLNYIHTGVKTLKIVNTLKIHLFRYLTPPPPQSKKSVCVWEGGAYPSRDDYTVFNIFIHIIKSWPGIFTIFTVFTQYRFESLWAYVIQYERNLSGRACECSQRLDG